MINDYPNCTYHGCDIADTTNKVLKINQFTYNHGNVVKGLPYKDNTFDFVHMRFFIFALRAEEWPIAIKEAIRVVKPGGMVQFYEGGFEVSADMHVVSFGLNCPIQLPEDTSSAYHRFVTAGKFLLFCSV
jgi:ubiquinone/menaquinone biosynthesis C-methylase UbiE